MATTRKTGRKPGRPPKPAGEKPEQFSVRLPPDMKMGLEILAADSGLSLSSAVELAVGQLLAAHKLSSERTAADVVSEVASLPEPVRMIALYNMSPRFLEFQDRMMVETILLSVEFNEIRGEADPAKQNRKSLEAKKFLIDHWGEIQSALRKKTTWHKKAPKNYSLKELIAPAPPPDDSDDASLFFRKTA